MPTRLVPRRASLSLVTVAAVGASLLVAGVAHAVTPPPGNDAIGFAQSVDLSGTTASASFFPNVTNATATDEHADAQLDVTAPAIHTVWYKFAPAPGQVSVTVSSSTIGHVVAGVVTTAAVDPPDGTNDTFSVLSDGSVRNTDAPNVGQALTVTTAAGSPQTFSFSDDAHFVPDAEHDYYLGVGVVNDGQPTTTGTITVSIDYTQAPANDDFYNATPLSATTSKYSGVTTAATPNLDAAFNNIDPYVGQTSMYSVWDQFTAPSNGRVFLSTAKSSFPVVFEVCTSTVPSPDNCAKHDVVDSTGSATPATSATFDALIGQTYYLFLDGQQVKHAPYHASGVYKLDFAFVAAPRNDDIATPTVLKPTGVVRVNSTNVGASSVVLGNNPPASLTTEAAHGLAFNHGARHTVWFSYTPKKSAPMVLAAGGLLDTDVEVFTGSLARGFKDTKIGDDDSLGLANSRVALPVRHGRTYSIGVDGAKKSNYPEAAFSLTIGPSPKNDNLDHATFLGRKHARRSPAAGKAKGSIEFATFQKDEKRPARGVGGRDVWYTFVAPKTATYTFSATGLAALLAAYSGRGRSNLGLQRLAVSASGERKARPLKLSAKAGQKFEISVDSTVGVGAKYTLRWH